MQVAAAITFFPLANARTEGRAGIELLVEDCENQVLVTAAKAGFGEILLDRHADFFRQRDIRDEIARGRIRIGEADLLALEVSQRLDAAVLAGNHDRVVTARAVRTRVGQDRVDGLVVLEGDGGIGSRTHRSNVDRAAKQALDNAVIVRRREQLYFGYAGRSLQAIGNALGVADLVGFVFRAVETDAQNLDVLGKGGTGEQAERRGSKHSFSEHGDLLFPDHPELGREATRP